MANLKVQVESGNNIDVKAQDGNSLSVRVQDGNSINVAVTPTPKQSIIIDRGIAGPAGPNSIGNYGFNIQNLRPKDVLMFGGAAWENTPQTEITDGGNY